METKLDKIANRLDSIDKTLTRQAVSLEEHIRRTVALEEALSPVKSFIDRCKGAIALIVGLGALKGLQAILIKLGFV